MDDGKVCFFLEASFAGDVRDSTSTSGGVLRVFGLHLVFQFRGCATSKMQFLTAVKSLKLIRLTQVYAWMVYQLCNLESVFWKRFPKICWCFPAVMGRVTVELTVGLTHMHPLFTSSHVVSQHSRPTNKSHNHGSGAQFVSGMRTSTVARRPRQER